MTHPSSPPPAPRPFHPHFDPRAVVSMLREFLRLETTAGFVLVLAAVLALIVANSPLAATYHYFLNDVYFSLGFSAHGDDSGFFLAQSVLHWINDGLMAVFFFLVGLEIKRELCEGELSTRDRALVPLLAALGGMVAPALIFLSIAGIGTDLARGWAIPSATDIAFTLGVLALLGPRVPLALKVMVTAIAVIDDLGAILIIALFYGQGLQFNALLVAALALLAMIAMNRLGVTRVAAYILMGVILWAAVLQSGVHATLAGVVAALCIPLRDRAHPDHSPLKHLEHTLHPWVAFGVLPVFSFANAGVPLAGVTLATLTDPLVLGITLGLFLGKQIGIFGVLWAAIKTGLLTLPPGVRLVQVYGVSILCGIGFTMSLFLGGLAYDDPGMQVEVRLGVILGSLLSALAGYALLRRTAPAAH